MEEAARIWTLAELAASIGGVCPVGGELEIAGPSTTRSDDPNGLAFAESSNYLAEAVESGVGAVIVPETTENFPKPHILHSHPRIAWYQVLRLFEHSLKVETGIHPTAVVHVSAKIHPTAAIAAYTVIDAGSRVEEDAVIQPFVHIGPRCTVGKGAIVHSHAVMVQDVHIDSHSTIGPGSVLGFSGFGYVWDGERHQRIPQVGSVEIGERTDIGALTAIDRATAASTCIGTGTKVDNLVQIAHNVSVGAHNVIASQVGIAGSTTLGDRVTVAGQVGFRDHLTIADDVTIGARSAVLGNVTSAGTYVGMPLLPMNEFLRWMAAQKELAPLIRKVRALEARIEELES